MGLLIQQEVTSKEVDHKTKETKGGANKVKVVRKVVHRKVCYVQEGIINHELMTRKQSLITEYQLQIIAN